MKILKLGFLFFTLMASLTVTANEPLNFGEKASIESNVLGETRPLWIYTPDKLEDNKRYNVVYLLDAGEHYFTVAGVLKSLIDNEQIPNLMLVGVETTNRPRDYFPSLNGEATTIPQQFIADKHIETNADNFVQFLKMELFPYIEKKYKTYPNKTLIGHSNAGTFALHAFYNYPDLFNNYLIVSPNAWWTPEQINQNLSNVAKQPRNNESLYITIASEGGHFYSGVMNLAAQLEAVQPKGVNWQIKQYPTRTHMSAILPAVTEGMEALFKDMYFNVTPELAKYSGVNAVLDYYKELSKKMGYTIAVPMDTFVELAEKQIEYARKEQAISTLQVFTKHYSDHAYSHMKLAQGYESLKNYQLALGSYEKALEIATQQKREPMILDALQDMVNATKTKL
ncbi:alpha/beta hydrolase-fold protein [Pseudoalteromonas xiamenensis]|uniref:Alpha/beta hydrolase n=1 Tax=Pseudoalteromonas xiamenensis TaxID=882626 RepID=A0A975DKS5_9GAMM|nr:alpha/beta hydrolase-fold protein [Pseudoalteromonas xiamenensis]QTH73354.1 alpha/beta hydrolase [Pseudoalteromonas xiamenensis]